MKSKKTEKIVADWLLTAAPKKLLVIIGPTASGKTEFAIQLAQKFGGEIVNADSRQIYRDVEIGTAKPTVAELHIVPHHLVSVFSPKKVVSVVEYRKLVEKKIYEILARGHLPILTGGHSLLISAIVENFQFPKKSDKSRRVELDKIWQKNPQKLFEVLQKLDPISAGKISVKNRHHLIRAIERAENSEKPMRARRKFDCKILGIEIEREKLYSKINQRVDKMLRAGLLAEVKNLAKKYDRYSPALRGHGYRELLDFLSREKSLEKAVTEIKRDTRNYAKRQMTWWRNSDLKSEIIWI